MRNADAPEALVHEVLERVALHGYFTEPAEGRERVVEVVQLWGGTVLDVRHVQPHAALSIGEDDDADLFAPRENLSLTPFPLVQFDDDRLWLCFSETMAGGVQRGEETLTLLQLVAAGEVETRLSDDGGRWYRLPLDRSTRARVNVGNLTFFVHLVPPGRRVGANLLGRQDWAWLGTLALTFLFVLGAISGATLLGALTLQKVGPDFAANRDISAIHLLPVTAPKPVRAKRARGGAAAPKPPGKAGTPDSPIPDAAGGPTRGMHQNRESQGALAVLREMDLAATFADGALLAGLDEHLGALHDGESADANGPGKWIRGPGDGGGGNGIHVAGFDRHGGPIPGAPHDGPPGKPDADVHIGGDEIITVSYSPEVIRRVVQGILPQIKACYDKGLRVDEQLGGKVVVRFQFGSAGRVTAARIKTSTMDGPQKDRVESCIVDRFQGLRFPPPHGGVVIVNYPLLLDSAG